ncbi:hypothetical protein Q31a_28850 [Aureliella helgolandensis]|uniref:Uncharacterized protein n=1 Tax=Aureliella helgolandensis TaxID=2527968 RepID=A0A518G7J9_9BACT|nr:hypothetical protein Q31a_28850 [Aureliella helgolandensis]
MYLGLPVRTPVLDKSFYEIGRYMQIPETAGHQLIFTAPHSLHSPADTAQSPPVQQQTPRRNLHEL